MPAWIFAGAGPICIAIAFESGKNKMPRNKGKSQKVISSNIKTEIKAGNKRKK